MWVLVEPGDTAVVPAPAYPIHLFAPILAGASVIQVELGGNNDELYDQLADAFAHARPRPRALIVSFPHNPTTRVVDLAFMERLVALARENEALVVHDFAYADVSFDGYQPPSILQVPGAADVAVETYSLTKSFSMAGWRVGFALGNAPALAALARLKSYLDYGTFQPIQIAAIVALNEARDYPAEACEIYHRRRNVLCDGLARIGWHVERPLGTMFVWAPIPEPYRQLGSLEFAVKLTREAHVSVSPGLGFGPGGEGFVRFALVENEQRIAQAVRGLRRALPELATAASAPASAG
jgi:alanine-synthesizing transaminase